MSERRVRFYIDEAIADQAINDEVPGNNRAKSGKQCKACPWKRSTVPDRDIPNGYCATKHAGLQRTIANPGDFTTLGLPLRAMACHESSVEAERPCVGWVAHQIGPGNNIALRMAALDGRFAGFQLDGPQHDTFEATLPKARKLPPKNDLERALDEFDKENPEVAQAYEDGVAKILGKAPAQPKARRRARR